MASYQDGIALCESLYEKCDELSDVDAAADFVESVKEKVEGIEETIRKYGRVSDNQYRALQNMGGGLDRWLERNYDRD